MRVVKLYSDWCAPCKILEQKLQRLDIKHESIDINTKEGLELSYEVGVRSVPTLLVFDDDNNLLRKMSGLPTDAEELKRFVYETDKS